MKGAGRVRRNRPEGRVVKQPIIAVEHDEDGVMVLGPQVGALQAAGGIEHCITVSTAVGAWHCVNAAHDNNEC